MFPQIEIEEKRASKVNLITRIYSNFVLKYPIVPLVLTILITFCLIFISSFLYGWWPTCNVNYYRWSGDEISDKWDSYLASTKNTYSSLQKLMTSSVSIPYQFETTQVGCMYYQKRSEHNKKINTNDIDENDNVLTAESLRAIWETEDKMHQTEGWPDYCYRIPKDLLPSFAEPILDNILSYMKDHLSELEEETNCLAFKSIITELKKYMRTTLNMSNPQSSQLTDQIIYDYVHYFDEEKNETIENRLKITYFGTDYKDMKTTRIRTLVMAGFPLKGFNSKHDRFNQQTRILGKWQVEFLKPLFAQIDNESSPIYPCAAFPFEIEYEIYDIVLQHLFYFGGALLFFIIVSCVAFKSLLVGFFGCLGTIFSLILTVAIINLFFQVHYFDVICAMALFMNCVVGGLVNFYIYQIYKNYSSFLFLVERTTKTMLSALFFNSFSNLALLYFGSRIGQYFGLYSFVLQLVYFALVFTWFLPFLSFYSKIKTKKFKTESMFSLNTILMTSVDEKESSFNEGNISMKKSTSSTLIKRDSSIDINPSYTNSQSTPNLASLNDIDLNDDGNTRLIVTTSTNSSNSNSNNSTNIFTYAETLNDYPHQSIFDFLKHKVTFKVNCCNQAPSNFIENFFGNYWLPFIYFYRIIFIVIAAILLAANIYFVTQLDTKNKFIFLKSNHRIQRAIDISTDGFFNPLNDNAFVYVWGLNPKSHKSYKNWAVVDDYGYHKSFNKTEVNFNLITNPKVQAHIMDTWNMLQNMTDIIDTYQSKYFGFNPWEMWDMIANTDFGPFDFIFKFLNITEPPKNVTCITPSEYNSYYFIWQLLLSLKTMQENDNYVPGTLFANTLGFSFDDYSLQFIGMKANMFLTKHNTKEELKKQYNRAKEIEKMIQDNAVKNGIPEFKGWMTSAAWIPLAVEENIVKRIIIIFFISLAVSLIGPILFVSYKMSLILLLGSFGSIVFTLGFLKISFGWEIGLNEALMIASSCSFMSVFLQIAAFDAFAKNNKKLPKYGKAQIAIMNSSFPSFTDIFILIACLVIIIFVPYQLFHPFIIYLFFLSLTSVVWSLIISPIVLSYVA